MSKKDIKIIQKDIFGRVGRLFSTSARMREKNDNNKEDNPDKLKGLEIPVRSVRNDEPVNIEVIPSRPYWQSSDGFCRVCHTSGAWLSIYGVLICFRCHSPVSPALVKEWIGRA